MSSPRDLTGFRLPPRVSVSKEILSHGAWAYVFRHQTLGLLGRIVLEAITGTQTLVSCEDHLDNARASLQAKRRAVFQPLAVKAVAAFEARASAFRMFWCLQQFTTINNRPYYALQQHGDTGLTRHATGYRREINALMAAYKIKPELFRSIDEEEFQRRWQDLDPEDFHLPRRYPQI